jgi:hypothetical protein
MIGRRSALSVIASVVVSVVSAGSAAHTAAPPPPGPAPEAVRAAKVTWADFVADHFATPTSIAQPCPAIDPTVTAATIGQLGLVPSDLPVTTAIVHDAVGAGIVALACGADLTKSPTPSGATSSSVHVTVLDGQAVFPQYVVRVASNNTPITPSPELGGEMASRCRNDGDVCVATWHSDGLVVTVRHRGPRSDDREAQVRAHLIAVAPQVVANLAAAGVA